MSVLRFPRAPWFGAQRPLAGAGWEAEPVGDGQAVGKGLERELTGESEGAPPPCVHLSVVRRCFFF